MVFTKITFLVLAAALGYSVATIGMKLASESWSYFAVALLGVGFLSATMAEIVLMRGIDLGVLYLIIIAVETLVVLAYAFSIGEGLSARQALGGVFIVVGFAAVVH